MITNIARRLLPRPLYESLKWARQEYATWRELGRVDRRLRKSRRNAATRPHDLAGQLLLSLTSYPARFRTLHLTLESLLQQDVRPDGILLWIAHDDIKRLPRKVKMLTKRGLTICPCDDVRSYKKLIFALEKYPEATIVTCDDDVFYPPAWLSTLTRAVDDSAPAILCHRAHRYRVTAKGDLAPYMQWDQDVQDDAARRQSTDIIPIGVGGILYPPRSFDVRVFDRQAFTTLCPNADDMWFYWMARSSGVRHRKVGPRFQLEQWPGSQDSRLFDNNREGGNDQQIAALIASFGLPGSTSDTLGAANEKGEA